MESLTVGSYLLSCPVWTSRALQCKECVLRKLSLPTSTGLKPDLSIVLGKCSLMPGAPTLKAHLPLLTEFIEIGKEGSGLLLQALPKCIANIPKKKMSSKAKITRQLRTTNVFIVNRVLSGTRSEGWAEDWDSSIGGRWGKGAGVFINHIPHGRYWINCYVSPPKEGHLA